MSTYGSTRARDYSDSTNGEHNWAGIPARIMLQPIAAPSVLGLYGFAGATFMGAANLAGWYGTTKSPLFLFPFAAIFGGVAQFAAGLWAYKARDALATAMHGTWGSFWIAYGIFWWLTANGTLHPPKGSTFTELGFWFVVLAAITAAGTVAAAFESGALFATLGTLTAGSILLALSLLMGSHTLQTWAGWVLVASAIIAWYTASAMMLASTTGRTMLPLFKWGRAGNVPGEQLFVPVEFHEGEPGIRKGQ